MILKKLICLIKGHQWTHLFGCPYIRQCGVCGRIEVECWKCKPNEVVWVKDGESNG